MNSSTGRGTLPTRYNKKRFFDAVKCNVPKKRELKTHKIECFLQ